MTVAAARTLARRLVERFGGEVATPWADVHRVFPAPSDLAQVAIERIAELGIIRSRAGAIQALAAQWDELRSPACAGRIARGAGRAPALAARHRPVDGALHRDARARLARCLPARRHRRAQGDAPALRHRHGTCRRSPRRSVASVARLRPPSSLEFTWESRHDLRHNFDPATLHGPAPHRLAARHAAARAQRDRPRRRLVRAAEAPPGRDRRARARRRSAARCGGASARRLLRRRIGRLRRRARPPGNAVPACRLGRAAAHRTGRDVQLRRHRAPARRSFGEPRRRRRGRQQSGLDHRPVPPRRRQHRLAHRLCRRPGAQDLAPAHRSRARGTRRVAAHASWSSIETARHRRAGRARGLVGRLVPVHAGRRAGVRADRPRLPARRGRRAVARAAAWRARRACGAAPTLADDRRRRPDQLGVAVPLLRLRRADDQRRPLGDLQLGDAALRRDRRLALARRPDDAAARARAWRSALPASSGSAGTRPTSARAGPPGRSPHVCWRRCRTACRRA